MKPPAVTMAELEMRGLTPLLKAGAATKLRRLGIVVVTCEFVPPRRPGGAGAAKTAAGQTTWAPRWAVALLAAEPVMPGPRWASLRRCLLDETFAAAVCTVIDACDAAASLAPRPVTLTSRLTQLAGFIQDQPDDAWAGYSQEDP